MFTRNEYDLYTSLMQLYYPLISSDGESSVTPLPREEKVKEAEPILLTFIINNNILLLFSEMSVEAKVKA